MTHYYRIVGAPTALARCRYSRKTSKVFNSQSQLQLVIGISMKNQHNNKPMLKCPLSMKVIFHFKPPKQHYNSRLNTSHTQTPDLDNCIKMYADIAQQAGIICNDSFIAHIDASKVWSDDEYTEIWFEEME
jgi:Holliday junction resolvase RusA-like endonuclease